jgi:hypothetical protein
MENFDQKMTAFVDYCRKVYADHCFRNGYSNYDQCEFSYTVGKRYAKVIRSDPHTSVFAFVDMDNGDIFKAASWNAPAKHARGNINHADTEYDGCVMPYGIVYLRG